jgi:hypothetical protein
MRFIHRRFFFGNTGRLKVPVLSRLLMFNGKEKAMFTAKAEKNDCRSSKQFGAMLWVSVIACCVSSIAHAEVTVKFIDAKHFADATWNGRMGASPEVLAELEKHIKTEAGKCLPAGQTLAIDVLNIDLAGRESRRIPQRNYRVMTEVEWPSVDLHFVRTAADGAVLEDTKETVTDMSYLEQRPYIMSRNEPLAFDKYMLTRWISKHFCSPQN